jgi:hypothetical protein
MNNVIKVLGNICGVSTFFMMFLGIVTVLTGGRLGIQEITFLMFVFFVLAAFCTMGREKDKSDKQD